MKVHELAKELKVESKELIKKIKELDIDIKNHLSILTEEQVEKVKNIFIVEDKDEEQEQEQIISQPESDPEPKQWKPDLNRMICVKNISRGKLIYKSKRQMGYTVEWFKKGDENYIELGEFMNLKNTDRRFVTEPWIRIIEDDEIEILKYANILQYYKGILGIDNVSDILTLDFISFKKRFDTLPQGYRNAVAEHAAEMIKNGTLDSIKIKNYIEEVMGISLDVLIDSGAKDEDTAIDIK